MTAGVTGRRIGRFWLGYVLVGFFLVVALWFAFKPFSVELPTGRFIQCGYSIAGAYRTQDVPTSLSPCLAFAHIRQHRVVEAGVAGVVVLTIMVCTSVAHLIHVSRATARGAAESGVPPCGTRGKELPPPEPPR